jgi:hypothetical protein
MYPASLFYYEDGGSRFVQNVDIFLPDYMASQCRKTLFTVTAIFNVNLNTNLSIILINPLVPELSSPHNLHKTGDLNGCLLFSMFLANNFTWFLVFSPLHCVD